MRNRLHPLLYALAGLALLVAGCRDRAGGASDAAPSRLKTANDVFWALQDMGYMATKETPRKSQHGCQPYEYLAQKDSASFRISVFECGSPERAAEIVSHPKVRHVDALLRNPGEGGVLQRGPLQIIVRRTAGDRPATEALVSALEQL